MRTAARQVKAGRPSTKKAGCSQPPPEKCAVKARAKAPKPPRVAPPEAESEDAPDDAVPAAESPPNKLLRDQYPPDPTWPPDEDPRGGHSSPEGAAIPGWLGWQFPRGISA